jgi:predicted hydrocarbon binding protein
MAKVKGSALAARLNFLRDQCTPEQQEQVKALLPAELTRQMGLGVFASQWYPLQHLVDLSRAIDQVKGRGDGALILEMGRQSAHEAVRGIYRIFFKIGSPEFVIQRAAQVWSRYYDSGQLEVEVLGKGHVQVRLCDFDTPMHEHCLSVSGWIRGMLEASGGKSVETTIVQCRKQGARACGFEARWQ